MPEDFIISKYLVNTLLTHRELEKFRFEMINYDENIKLDDMNTKKIWHIYYLKASEENHLS